MPANIIVVNSSKTLPWFSCLTVLILSFSACASPDKSPAASSRVIKAGDILLFRLVEAQEDTVPSETVTEAKLKVGPDGKVRVPLAGTFILQGKTLAEARAIVERPIAAKHEWRTAHLAFPPEELTSGKTVKIDGSIAFPAKLSWYRGLTLVNALEASGGAFLEADLKKISVMRSGEVIQVNARDPKGRLFSLQPGDNIFVAYPIW